MVKLSQFLKQNKVKMNFNKNMTLNLQMKKVKPLYQIQNHRLYKAIKKMNVYKIMKNINKVYFLIKDKSYIEFKKN